MSDVQRKEPSRRGVLNAVAVAGAMGLGAGALGGCAEKPATPKSLGSTDQVPVGGSALFRDAKVVVAQPVKGEFKAFSAVCTHQSCVLASLRNNVAGCPCHGSEFNALTGAVVQGPAMKALPEVTLTVKDGKMTA